MLIKQKVNVVVPSKSLGELIAQDTIETQRQVLTGFADETLRKLISNHQPIISLVAILPVSTLIVIAKLYKEALRQELISPIIT